MARLPGRGFFHSLIVQKIQDKFQLEYSLPRAVDVGCGTGKSTRALKSLAQRVDGIDSSAAMLEFAEAVPDVYYHCASAEEMPFEDATVNLITASSALHWFDRRRFLQEVHRILVPGGYFVVYENGFPGRMIGNDRFHEWQQRLYQRFPRTPRDNRPFTEDDALEFGLEFNGRENYQNVVDFSLEELSLYLSTQSNAVESIERGSLSAEQFRKLVERECAEFLTAGRASFEFAGFVWYLRKVAAR